MDVAPTRAGLAFLAGARDSAGLWTEFQTPAGAADEWVTSYVGVQVGACAGGLPLARQAWLAVLGRCRAGWGYNARAPRDADSTAWAGLLAERVGEPARAPALRAAFRRLDRHADRRGGLRTFVDAGELQAFTGLHGNGFEGWRSAHGCVTAAAAQLSGWSGGPAARRRLLGLQEADGRWRSYWWCDDEYATCLAAHALAGSPAPAARLAARRAAAWALGRLGRGGAVAAPEFPEGSPFATALALLAALAGGLRGPRAAAAARWLEERQREDGSWAPSARLRIPAPECAGPDPGRWRLAGGGDEAGFGPAFTTATVVRALDAFHASGGGRR